MQPLKEEDLSIVLKIVSGGSGDTSLGLSSCHRTFDSRLEWNN
jgi:hypothetical protein